MAASQDYSSQLQREYFMFYEMRIVAKLMHEGLSKKEIVEKVTEENSFQFPTERKISQTASSCFKRLDSLESDELVAELAEGPMEIAKQINLYSMMRSNRLVWEFMITVIGEKYRTQDLSYSRSDVNTFFMRLQEQNDQVASWSEGTVKRVKPVLTKALAECGYLDSVTATKLNPIYPFDELVEGIMGNGDFDALAAFNYFG